jgi:hypothetical protein
MASDKRDATEPEGWTPQEKGQGAGRVLQDTGDAGEAAPKAKPTDDRAATESAAARIEQDGEPEARPGGGGKG